MQLRTPIFVGKIFCMRNLLVMSIPDGEDGTEDGGGCEVGVAGGAAVAIR